MNLSRREFLQASATGLGAFLWPRSAWSVSEDPHFFLNIYVYGGVDSLFLFDGRPQAMTAAGLIHDHVKEEPRPWSKEGKCLATSFARRLEPHRQRFSIVNGVVMATAFDGHAQNINFLYTGNPFGGESFVPHTNFRDDPAYSKRPLDAIQAVGASIDLTNGGNTVPLNHESAFKLIESLKSSRDLSPEHPVIKQIASRFSSLGQGGGRFSAGSRAMWNGYLGAPGLSEKLRGLTLQPPSSHTDFESGFIELMAGFFRAGICSSALLQIAPPADHLDVHSGSLARRQPMLYLGVIDRLLRVFDLLANTSYDNQRSLFDVTTVLFSSEFGRSLRQPGLPLNETGTDHNGLSNSLIIGGKGIRGGLVIGESDRHSMDEKVSGAHRILDPAGLKLMGRPFDFKTGLPRQDKPETYDPEDYLNIASVVNTIYSCFSVPQSKWRTVKRDGPKAPILAGLLR